ncbi:MAG TPA: type II secretion system F family protein [Hyphomonadaceae bacterium]|jgi:tight adherence protein C|nr:type II secretion system F family protein [Hyphomonadaceae bacterium]
MEIVHFLTEPMNLAGILAAVAVFATIMTLAAPMFAGDKLTSRLKAVANRREELRKRSRAALDSESTKKSIRVRDESAMKKVVDKLDLQKMLEDPTVAKKLIQAGLRGPKPISIFYFCRFALPIAFGIAVFIYIFFVNDHGLSQQMKFGAVGVGIAAGFYGPNIYVENLIGKRRTSIMRAFPDSLDMMLICVESGMSIEMAFARVGEEIGTASAELAEELALTTAELSYLQDRRSAYVNLAERTNHPGVKGVAMALTQAEKYGTPMGSALRVMAKENREMRITEAEKKAAALPAKLTVPMIVFFLPVLFLVILGPAFIKISDMGFLGPKP